MDWKYEEGRIYSINEEGDLIAETNFVYKKNGEVDKNHTYVAPALRGQGLASKMMAAVAGYLREKGLKATASCSYAYDWFQRNGESYSDVISKEINGQPAACRIDGRH